MDTAHMPHRHDTRTAHTPPLAARHLDDRTGEIPVAGYVGRHRKPEGDSHAATTRSAS